MCVCLHACVHACVCYIFGSEVERIHKKHVKPRKAGIPKVWVDLLTLCGRSCCRKNKFSGDVDQGLGSWNLREKHHPETLGQSGNQFLTNCQGVWLLLLQGTEYRNQVFFCGWRGSKSISHFLCLEWRLGRECDRDGTQFIPSTEGKFSLSQMDDKTNLNAVLQIFVLEAWCSQPKPGEYGASKVIQS